MSELGPDMKTALWRIIANHQPSLGTDHMAERGERLTQYKIRLLAWIDAGSSAPVPEPLRPSYRRHWPLHRKLTAEIANHRRAEDAA